MPLGYFILSLDTELAWGSFDRSSFKRRLNSFERTRTEIRRLLEMLDHYHVPATWAFVGHLMLERCERRNGRTHEDVLRPRYKWFPNDWHALDPATNVTSDPLWYGTDILRWVLDAQVRHEIASHTFSHVVVQDPACSREIALSQFRKCCELHTAHGLQLNSVVYPRNRVAHLDVLRDLGIIAYRGVEESWFHRFNGAPFRIAHLIHRALGLSPPTYPLSGRAEEGLVNLPASMFLLPMGGLRTLVPIAARRRQALCGLDRAAERGEIFHLWFHPFNLASSRRLPELMEEILQRVAELRIQGRIQALTMSEMAVEVLGREKLQHRRFRVARTSV